MCPRMYVYMHGASSIGSGMDITWSGAGVQLDGRGSEHEVDIEDLSRAHHIIPI